MMLRVGRNFTVEVFSDGVFARVPFIGEAFIGGRGLTAFSPWSAVRKN
jgi:hypothetical protein